MTGLIQDIQGAKSVLTEAANTLAGGLSSFIEAKDDSGKIWEIRVINAGKSKNNVLYPETLLRESVVKFEGARVFQKSDSEHIKGDGKDFGKLIGRLSNPRFIEASKGIPAGINADFSVLQTAGETAAKIKELYDRNMSDVFGFSIDVGGAAKNRSGFREAVSITKVNSVDLIIEPGAGGQLIRLVEAKQEVDTMRDRMIEAVKAANNGQLPAGLDVDNDAALSAANATLDSLRARYDDEKQRIDDINSQAREVYQNQMDYYRSMRDAMQSLLDLANGFADDSREASDTLKAAQLDYNATLKAARGGDLEAAKKLGDAAGRLKTSLGATYNNDDRAASAIQQIESQLRATAGTLGNLAGSQPNDPGTITSTLLASLESQIKAQESVVSSLQSIANNTNSTTIEAKAAADRAAMAKELATKIGELGLATDRSAWQILAANGINIKDLAADFGINVNKLDATFIKNTADLATRLNVNSLDLLTRLNVNFSDLAKSFNIDVNNLNNGTLGKLDKLADQLRVSSVDLAGKLGINIDKLGDLMANKLASLPGLPDNIRAGLAPHLQDIRNAADPATLKKELKELQAYVNSLPPGIKEKLQGQLDGILGYTGGTKDNTADTKNETLALRSIRSSVDNTSAHTADLTAYTRDQVNARGIQLALQNSRALNQHAASIGKAAIPSFAIGNDNLPRDMLANVHRGEMIFTAAQSHSMRDLALHNQSVIPQIAGYLSEIAANDERAPVFVQPVYAPPANPPRQKEGDQGELLEEIKGLRKDNAELRKTVETLIPYQSAIANNTRKTAAMQEKWDMDGQPEERVA